MTTWQCSHCDFLHKLSNRICNGKFSRSANLNMSTIWLLIRWWCRLASCSCSWKRYRLKAVSENEEYQFQHWGTRRANSAVSSAVWPVLYACAQLYQPGSGSSCFVLATTHQHSMAQGETSVIHGCHCPDDALVRMRKVLVIPRSLQVCFSAEIDFV